MCVCVLCVHVCKSDSSYFGKCGRMEAVVDDGFVAVLYVDGKLRVQSRGFLAFCTKAHPRGSGRKRAEIDANSESKL